MASDTALLKLAAILTHNVGDVDQGLNYWQVSEREGDRRMRRRRRRNEG